MCLQTKDLECHPQVIERIAPQGRFGTAQFVPYRFEFTNKLTKQQRLLVAFDALVLSEAIGREVPLGKIMHGDGHATMVTTGRVRPSSISDS